jgi:uncharacterized membrane protein
VFSYFTIAKHNGFASFAWDLGIFDQALHTTAFNGRFLYTTTELYLNPSGCYFGMHFSPILLILLPFYAIYPNATALLVLQSFIIAIAALPLYLLVIRLSGNQKLGLALGAAYLLYPATQASNWFDFHQQAFIPLLIFSMCYFLCVRKTKLFFASVLLALMIEEHVAMITFVLGLYFLLTTLDASSLVKSIRQGRLRIGWTSAAMCITIVLSVVWYLAAKYVRLIFPISPEFWDLYRAVDTFKVLGFQGDILSLPVYIIFNPQRTLEAFLSDYYLKFFYFLVLFAPLLFFSLRSKISLAGLLTLAPFLLTNYRPYYIIGAQYPLYIIPFVFLAAAEGLSGRKIVEKSSRQPASNDRSTLKLPDLDSTLKTMVVVLLIFCVSLSPISPIAYEMAKQTPFLWYATPYANEWSLQMHEMINMIPPSASVLTQNTIFPHVSNRIDAYVIPVIDPPGLHNELASYIREQISKVDYVLLDLVQYDLWRYFVLDEVVNNNNFNVYSQVSSICLFRRGYTGAPIFVPNGGFQIFLPNQNYLIAEGILEEDATSSTGYAVLSPANVVEGNFLYGPYVCLAPWTYNVIFEVKLHSFTEGSVAVFDVCGGRGNAIFAQKELAGSEVPNDKWINVTLPFSIEVFRPDAEFRVFKSGSADLYVDRIIIEVSGVS